MHTTLLLAAIALLGAMPLHAQDLPLSGKALATELQRGGYVLMFRHGATDWSNRDEGRSRLEDCSTQRNLSDAGRSEMRRVGEAIRALHIPIGAVTASPFCRTRETAQLVFGRTETSPDLLWPGFKASTEAMAQHRAAVGTRLGTAPSAAQNTVIVTHGFVIQDATQRSVAEGEAVVLHPEGGRKFTVVARVLPTAWADLEKVR
ncbi:MAG TPA: histidine phosphatase family protein [bacterium]